MTTPKPASQPASAENGAKSFLIFLGSLVVLVGVGVAVGAVFFGPEQKKQYDRSSPELVLAAAQDMIANNDAERLTELLYADSLEMEDVYARLGRVLGSLQDLAVAINERFPEEIAAARAKAEQEARSGRAVSLLEQFNPSRRGPPSGEDEERWNDLLQAIATDPYAWIEDAEGRLSFAYIDDERVAVLWDERPVLPPLGLAMQQDGGEWSVVLPLQSIPMSSRFLPQTPEEYSIWGSILLAVDNVVRDLETDVRSGELQSLDALARVTGEKAVPVMMGCMIAYNKALQERRRREREARQAQEDAQQEAEAQAADTDG